MIKRLQLRNFRAHKKLDVRFGNGVNSIIGNNYAGKSTILRAIRYASQNKPSGDSVIRWGATRVSVRITDEKKNKVKRIRGKSVNLYKLNDKEFKAFGNKVPEEIQKTLGLSDINFQGQHDAPFWFSKTAGEVSRELNVIVNLDVIDSTLSTVQSGIQSTKSLIGLVEKRRDNFKEEKNRLKYVKELNKSLKLVESLNDQKDKNAVGLARIEKLLKSGVTHAQEREMALFSSQSALFVRDKCLEAVNISKKAKSLSGLVLEVKNLQQTLTYKVPSFDKIKATHAEAEEVIAIVFGLEDLIYMATKQKEIICDALTHHKTLKEKLKRKLGKRCPLCEKKL
jgi:DNA repair protein SbcC/Rad50